MAKKGLGRGLDALLGETKAEDVIAPKQTAKTGDYVETIKIVDIEPNPNQPRNDFDEESL